METYEAPTFEVIGSVLELTLANGTGNTLDATFPRGTPKSALTFS
jgi:hypothetical protein